MKYIKLENTEDLQYILNTYKYVIMQFSASWCGPCQKITPEMEKWAYHFKSDDIVYVYCDVDVIDSALTNRLAIKSVPSFVIYLKSQLKFGRVLVSSNYDEVMGYISNHLN